jgi:hypothetical protein
MKFSYDPKTKKMSALPVCYDIANKMISDNMDKVCDICNRNLHFTNVYGVSYGKLIVFKEGWYLILYAARSKCTIWASDKDGEFIYGRKPKHCHELYHTTLYSNWLEV